MISSQTKSPIHRLTQIASRAAHTREVKNKNTSRHRAEETRRARRLNSMKRNVVSPLVSAVLGYALKAALNHHALLAGWLISVPHLAIWHVS